MLNRKFKAEYDVKWKNDDDIHERIVLKILETNAHRINEILEFLDTIDPLLRKRIYLSIKRHQQYNNVFKDAEHEWIIFTLNYGDYIHDYLASKDRAKQKAEEELVKEMFSTYQIPVYGIDDLFKEHFKKPEGYYFKDK